MRADISVQGESVEASFLGDCGNSLKGRFGHYQSNVYSFQGAELPQAGDARVMIVPLAEPCAGANKRKLKFASWFRLRPVALEVDHFAVLLADDDGALIAPLPTQDGASGPVVTQVTMNALSKRTAINRRAQPGADDITLDDWKYSAMVYRAAPDEWGRFLGEAEYTTPSGRYSFFPNLRYGADTPQDTPRSLRTLEHARFSDLLTPNRAEFFYVKIRPQNPANLPPADVPRKKGRYDFLGLHPVADRLTLMPGDIRFANSIAIDGQPMPLWRSETSTTVLLGTYLVFDNQTGTLFVPTFVSLRLSYLHSAARRPLKALEAAGN